ncbi:uncharacterized protein LOC129618972 isoform X2 [Condylostylus longicornis]|nr:uncharacterized protein LOC129618972 isoform X2 [Condylostylus longicornis]XP_055389989.1 uncharacterized protein LOC129618972 isoform X2 [Condylostylus longicornis]XP_055389990.1 uncharacterized protein LOC129618972 isoform X2 [Condylostylus longicornis]
MTKTASEPEIKLETAPFDPRFPNQNQTRHCWSSYVDFYRCQRIRGVDYEPCQYFKKVFTAMCPREWVEKWDDQREQGTFAGKL